MTTLLLISVLGTATISADGRISRKGVYAKETFFTLDMKNSALKDVFREIEKSSEYIFFYLDNSLDMNRKVSVKVHNKVVNAILDKVFEGTDNRYYISDRQIIISKENAKSDMTLLPAAIQPSKRTLTGTVVDELGPLAGANVAVKGTTIGTISDEDGKFTLENVPQNAVLQVSYIGYRTQEITGIPSDGKPLIIILKEDSQALEEIVVVGYGMQKKVTLTGAVSQVTGQDITSKTSTDIMNALQGQMAGVQVLRSSGQPGSEAKGIRVRGFTSANDASALVLIDGVEGDMKLLNPDDVESISVLKDASSASIYGSRAAAGVILITTKKGTAGAKAKISYNGSFGVNIPGFMPQRMSPWEEQAIINNDGRLRERGALEQDAEHVAWLKNPNFNYRPNDARWEAVANSNWLNEGSNDYTTSQNHALAVNGGSENLQYYVSAGYYNKTGLLKYDADNYSRYNLRATLNAKLNQYVDLNIIAGYDGSMTKQPSYSDGSTSILSLLYNSRARQQIYLPTEDTNYANNPFSADLQANAIDILQNGGSRYAKNEKYTGKAGIRFHDFIKGLSIDLNLSRRADYYNFERNGRYVVSMGRNGQVRGGGTGAYSANNPNFVEKTKNIAIQDKLEALLNYDFKFDLNAFHLLLGASYENYEKDQITATGRNLLSNDFFSLNYYDSSTATNSVMSDLIQPWKMASLFGRLDYNYAEKYLFQANFRYDGSSRLAPGKRWGLFPSVGVAWRISEEGFFEHLKEHIGNLKIRADWGKLGNSTVLNSMYYPYIGLITNKTSAGAIESIFGKPVYYQKELASQDITWETVTSTDIGIDLGLLNNRLNITADYYWKRNSDMLSKIQVSHLVGVGIPYVNMGELKIWGWEVSANWRDRVGELNYSVGFNIEDSQNKLVKFGNDDIIDAKASVAHLQGYPLNTIWGYKTDGFWQSRDEYLAYKEAHPGYITFDDAKIWGGDVKYLDLDGNGVIGGGSFTPKDKGDLVYMGTTNGRYLYGFNLNLQYRGFDFSAFFQGVGKRSFFIHPNVLCPLYASYEMPWTIHQDYWREDNKDAYFARINGTDAESRNYYYSDKWVQNGAYIRLKNIQLGYNIPVPKKIIESVRFYISGNDVWEHSNVLSVFDPESDNNVGRSYYPFFRTWTTGLNITF
jgi:TonB-linked SusC/RagA family outer membrane protein